MKVKIKIKLSRCKDAENDSVIQKAKCRALKDTPIIWLISHPDTQNLIRILEKIANVGKSIQNLERTSDVILPHFIIETD